MEKNLTMGFNPAIILFFSLTLGLMKQKSDNILITFGARLKRIRNEKGYSQRELAANCDIDNADISRMENGLINISLQTLEQLAEALDVSPCDFFDCE